MIQKKPCFHTTPRGDLLFNAGGHPTICAATCGHYPGECINLCLDEGYTVCPYMGVSKNRGTPQIIHFNRVWNHYKPSHFGGFTPIFGNTHICGNLHCKQFKLFLSNGSTQQPR